MNSLRSDVTRLRAGFQDISHSLDRLLDDMAGNVEVNTGKALRNAATHTQAFVHRNPWQVVGIAAAAAFLLGLLAHAGTAQAPRRH